MGEKIKDIPKFHVKIGGMSCSFCVETIEKAYRKQEGVENVNVSLSHEEALITYNPSKISKGEIEKTLIDLGYTIRDAKRVKAFEEQEEELRLAKKHLLTAGTFTLISLIFMILMWSGIRLWWFRWPMLFLALATMFGPGWPTLITLAMAPILMLTYYRLARKEEVRLEAQFGEAYIRYRQRAPMFVRWLPSSK